jgi:tetratricopeptide (TPR) repeat protein
VRAALEWNRTAEGDPQLGLRLAGAIWIFWQIHNYASEGRARLAAALAAAPEPTIARAKALNGAGFLARCQHELAVATELLEASVALFRSLGDPRGVAHALNNLGTVAIDQHDYGRASALCEASLALCRELGDTAINAWALTNLGHLAWHQRNLERSLRLHVESLALFQELGGKRGIAYALGNLARMAYVQRDYHKAAGLYHESLALFRALDDKQSVAWALASLGEVALAQGDSAQAAALIEESLPLLHALGDKQGIATALSMLGLVAETRDDPSAARAYYDESLRLAQAAGDQEAVARAILGQGYVALMEHDGAAAHQLFAGYVSLAHELGHKRMAGLGVCVRDAALARDDWGRAVALLEQDLAQFQVAGDEWGACIALHMIGLIMLQQGRAEQAWERYHQSLALAYAIDDRLGLPMRLAGLAAVALARGDDEQAARLCGAAEAIQEALGSGLVLTAMVPIDREHFARTLAEVRARLEDAALGQAWADGRAMSIAEAVAYALDDASHPPAAGDAILAALRL